MYSIYESSSACQCVRARVYSIHARSACMCAQKIAQKFELLAQTHILHVITTICANLTFRMPLKVRKYDETLEWELNFLTKIRKLITNFNKMFYWTHSYLYENINVKFRVKNTQNWNETYTTSSHTIINWPSKTGVRFSHEAIFILFSLFSHVYACVANTANAEKKNNKWLHFNHL